MVYIFQSGCESIRRNLHFGTISLEILEWYSRRCYRDNGFILTISNTVHVGVSSELDVNEGNSIVDIVKNYTNHII